MCQRNILIFTHCILMNNKDCFDLITDNYVNENDVNQSQEQKAKRAEQIAAPRHSRHADRVAFEQDVKTIGAGSAGIPLPLFCSVTSDENGPFLWHLTRENDRQWSACPFLGRVASPEGRGSRRMSQ